MCVWYTRVRGGVYEVKVFRHPGKDILKSFTNSVMVLLLPQAEMKKGKKQEVSQFYSSLNVIHGVLANQVGVIPQLFA